MGNQGLFRKGETVKKAGIAAMVLSLAFALPAFAADTTEPLKRPAPTFEQSKAQILKQIDERSTKLQQEKSCVQAATSDEDLKACRAKFGPPRGSGGPGGMGRPGRPGSLPPPGGQTAQ
jgi:hypothetical protein